MEPCDARAVQRRTTSASENAGTARQGQQGPERGSGRPAGHASALQVDGSHTVTGYIVRDHWSEERKKRGAGHWRAAAPGFKFQV